MDDIIQRGISIGDEQISQLARPAVELAEAACLVQIYKAEVLTMRNRTDVRAHDYTMMRESYKGSKRRFRECLAAYKKTKKDVCK